MKRLMVFVFSIVMTVSMTFAQDTLSLQITGEQYKQIEKHFRQKIKDENRAADWAKFYRYEALNDSMQKPAKVVFMGNSITDRWYRFHPEFFTENGYTCRGISGQTTSHMLVRFQADVIDLHPKIVMIMAGTNDIARNNGIISLEHTMQNIISMCELAKLHKIRPILCSILPAKRFRWNPELTPAEDIRKLNSMIQAYAKKNGIIYVDYYSAMVDEEGGLNEAYTDDYVHPTLAGYAVMEPIALKTLKKLVK